MAAAGAGAQTVVSPLSSLSSAPAFRPAASVSAPALLPLGAPAAGPLVPSLSAAQLPALPTVAGTPGPGVTPAHVAAVQRLADESGMTWFIHGSRQTGVRSRDGSPFSPTTDLDLGLVGDPQQLFSDAAERWDGVPHAAHGPMAVVPSVEEAVARGHLVVSPRRAAPEGELGRLARMAEPVRTSAQLAALVKTKRAADEPFRFAVIGDAEPGRFWIWRRLFNRSPDAFWTLLSRADRAGADFIVQLGDMVSRGIPRNFAGFLARLRAAALRTPYLTVIGNHDRHSPHGVTNDRVYRTLFGGTDYAFDRGGWRFVVVDTSAGRLSSGQLAWLKGTLDGRLPAVVFTHMPPAPLGEFTDFGRKGSGGFKEGAEEFMKLMSERRVSRVYLGHVHALGVVDRGGVRYILTGGGGSPLFPGPVKTKLHHSLTVEIGPDGPVETVHPLDGEPFLLH